MFTGIVAAVGSIGRVEKNGSDLRLRVDAGALDLSDVRIGDSIAVSGVCLTAVDCGGGGFSADVSRETLDHTTLRAVCPGMRVNLEKALAAGERLGGHLVSGHVDGTGRVLERWQDGQSVRLAVEAPAALARYIAPKGSICVDGVSLTVNAVRDTRFDLNIVPHTAQQTTLGEARAGKEVNLEVDLIARYLERLLVASPAEAGTRLDEQFLAAHGFIREPGR